MSETAYSRSQVLLSLLVLSILAVCLPSVVLGARGSFTEEQVKELAAEFERTHLEADATLIGVKRIRNELIQRVIETQKMLLTLEQKATAHFEQIQALLRSDQGKLKATRIGRKNFYILPSVVEFTTTLTHLTHERRKK